MTRPLRHIRAWLLATVASALLALSPLTAFAQDTASDGPFKTSSGATKLRLSKPQVDLPPVTSEAVRTELTARLLKLPGVRAVTPLPETDNVLRLIAHNDMTIRLDTLVARLNAQGSDRDQEFGRFVSNVRGFLSRTDPFTPERLRIVVRKRAAVDAFETESAVGDMRNLVVRRPFLDDLEEVVVGDTTSAIALMPIARLADLSLSAEEAFAIGRANVEKENANVTWRAEKGLLRAQISSGYETSLIALDAVWPKLEQRLGGPIAIIVPTRDTLIVGRVKSSADRERLRVRAQSLSTGPHALSPKLWLRHGGVWVAG